MKRVFLALAACAALTCAAFAAAPTVTDISARGIPFVILSAITSNANCVTLGKEDYTIVHTGFQEDGVTASASGDYVVIARVWSQAQAAVTTDPNLGDGISLPLFSGASVTLPGDGCTPGPDGPQEIQIQAVAHGAKILIVKGRKP